MAVADSGWRGEGLSVLTRSEVAGCQAAMSANVASDDKDNVLYGFVPV